MSLFRKKKTIDDVSAVDIVVKKAVKTFLDAITELNKVPEKVEAAKVKSNAKIKILEDEIKEEREAQKAGDALVNKVEKISSNINQLLGEDGNKKESSKEKATKD